jgi:hypothetical protein
MALGILIGVAVYGAIVNVPEFSAGGEAISGFNPQRVAAAESARLTGLAGMYAQQQAKVERVQAAEIDRLNGLADFYVRGSSLSRGHHADAARLTGLAEAILFKERVARQAEIDRLTGLAAHYEGLRTVELNDMKFLMDGYRETVTRSVTISGPTSVDEKFTEEGWLHSVSGGSGANPEDQKFTDEGWLQSVTGSSNINPEDQKFSDEGWLEAVSGN